MGPTRRGSLSMTALEALKVGLRALTEDILTQELRPLLTNWEVKGLLARRDLLLEFFHREIAKRGEAAVIRDMSGH